MRSSAHNNSVLIHGPIRTPGRKDQRSKEFAAAKKGKLSFFWGGDSGPCESKCVFLGGVETMLLRDCTPPT